jgi:hypothetical protein
MRYVVLGMAPLLWLSLSGCAELGSTVQGAEKKPVTVENIAGLRWSFGPWWEPPGDEKQLKDFDDELDGLIDGSLGHDDKN